MTIPIHIDSLSKRYSRDARSAPAVDALTLDITPGEMFFLLGPSGCGKTTLLRMIAGFIEPSSGKILFAGRDVTRLAANKRNTGMVFQSYALWPHMTVAQNVEFGLRVRKVPRAQRRERTLNALRKVQMDPYADRKPNELSGGQQQRVALARALVVQPDILLLDEPLSNLDAKLRLELRSEIRRICKDAGITTVYVTHDQKEALSMADRIAIMRAGRIEQIGSPSDLYERPRTAFVAAFLGETNLVKGRVEQISNNIISARTNFGNLTIHRIQSSSDPELDVGDEMLCSIRPERVTVASPHAATSDATPINRWRGAIAQTTYLGDSTVHSIDVVGDRSELLRSVQLGPRTLPTADDLFEEMVEVQIHPSDVVIVSA